jgi:hypothetical protein
MPLLLFIMSFLLCVPLAHAQQSEIAQDSPDDFQAFEVIVYDEETNIFTHVNQDGDILDQFTITHEGEEESFGFRFDANVAFSPDASLIGYIGYVSPHYFVRVYDRATQSTIYERRMNPFIESIFMDEETLVYATGKPQDADSPWEITHINFVTGDVRSFTGLGSFVVGEPFAAQFDEDDGERIQWKPEIFRFQGAEVYVHFTSSGAYYYLPTFVWNVTDNTFTPEPYLHSMEIDYLAGTGEFLVALPDERLPYYRGYGHGTTQVNSFHVYRPDDGQSVPIFNLPIELRRIHTSPKFIQGGERILYYAEQMWRMIERDGTPLSEWRGDYNIGTDTTFGVYDGFVAMSKAYNEDRLTQLLFWNTRTGERNEPTVIYTGGEEWWDFGWVSVQPTQLEPRQGFNAVAPPLPNDDTSTVEGGVGIAVYVNIADDTTLLMYEEPSLDAPLVERELLNGERAIIVDCAEQPIEDAGKMWWCVSVDRGWSTGWVHVTDEQLATAPRNDSALFANNRIEYEGTSLPVIENGDRVVVVTDAVNVRAEAGFDADILSVLVNGTEVIISDEPVADDGLTWYFVRFTDDLEGWVALTDALGEVLIAPVEDVAP